MSKKSKHQLYWLTSLILIAVWIAFTTGMAANQFSRKFDDQQKAKSQMIASVIQKFIHEGPITKITNLWDDNYEKIEQTITQSRWDTREPIAAYRTIYSDNPYVQKLADRIISSAEADPAIAAVAVVDRNGFTAWGWSRTDEWRVVERRPMATQLLYEIRQADDLLLLYERNKGNIILAASPIHMDGSVWGYAVIGFYPLKTDDMIALAANSITGVFVVATMIVLIPPAVGYWRRRRGRGF